MRKQWFGLLILLLVFSLCFIEVVNYRLKNLQKYNSSEVVIVLPIPKSKDIIIKDESIDAYFIEEIIQRVSSEYDVDINLIKAVIKVESNWNMKAVSKVGAKGLMQLMPETAKELGVKDIFNPEENIDAGVRFLKYLLQKFDYDLTLVLAAYNSGPARVAKLKRVPRIRETKLYIKKVLKYYNYYKTLGV